MTCAIPRPSPKTLFERIKNQFSANVLGGGNVIPESLEHYVVANDYLAAETFYSIAEQQWRERDPRMACCDNLVAMAADRGMYPRSATFARGYVTLTGAAGAALSQSMQFMFGQNYYRADITTSIPATMPASGTVSIAVIALEPGANGNEIGTAGSPGTMVASLTGINQAVTACGNAFCNGRDAETCEAFRSRYIDWLQYNPKTFLDWASEKLLEWPCLTRVCLRNCGCCETMHELQLHVFFDGTFENGIAPINVLTDVSAWFFGTPQGVGAGQAPFGVRGALYSATAAKLNIVIDGLQCTLADQTETIRERIAQLFLNLCPGVTLCRRQIELVVAQVVGASCTFDVFLEIPDGVTGLSISDCGDIVADCDVLPVLGVIEIPTVTC